MTVWHEAAFGGELDVRQKIWEWAEERLTTEEIKNELLLGTDHEGRNPWQLAAYLGKRDVMQIIWDFAEEKLTREEMKIICY
jgi:hypothetical protein